QQLTDELEYKKVKSKKGNGQLKLFLGEIFFLNQIINDQDFINLVNSNTQVILLYIGSGPGIHITQLYKGLKNYKNIYWHLYDRTKHFSELINLASNSRNRISIFERYFRESDVKNYLNKNIIFISDIRGIEDKEPKVEELIHDYNLQNYIIKIVQPQWTSIKWRCPFPDEYKR